jgi:hypothetical protein
MIATDMTREECMVLAQKHEWHAENARDAAAAARQWAHVRYFRSVALIAKPAVSAPTPKD